MSRSMLVTGRGAALVTAGIPTGAGSNPTSTPASDKANCVTDWPMARQLKANDAKIKELCRRDLTRHLTNRAARRRLSASCQTRQSRSNPAESRHLTGRRWDGSEHRTATTLVNLRGAGSVIPTHQKRVPTLRRTYRPRMSYCEESYPAGLNENGGISLNRLTAAIDKYE